MVDQEQYHNELQKIIDDTKSVEGINEHWKEVLETLDHLSVEYAKELQAETGIVYQKEEGSSEGDMTVPPISPVGYELVS